MDEPLLLIETSGRGGRVGLAAGGDLRERPLDPARRHARDLAPAVAELLAEAGLKPADVRRVAVSVGPGSFTGLRVGVMSAKAFAYATGCELVAVPTFAAVAEQTPTGGRVLVVADALQGLLYAQRFAREADGWRPVDELRITPANEVAAGVQPGEVVSGPGALLLGAVGAAPESARVPTLPAMLAVARRLAPLPRDEMLALEPLYLRGSSAEEKAAREGRP